MIYYFMALSISNPSAPWLAASASRALVLVTLENHLAFLGQFLRHPSFLNTYNPIMLSLKFDGLVF